MGLRVAELGLVLCAIVAPLVPILWKKTALTNLSLVPAFLGVVWGAHHWSPMAAPLLCCAGSVLLSAMLANEPRLALCPLEGRGTGAVTSLAWIASAWVVTQLPVVDRHGLLVAMLGVGVLESALALAQKSGWAWALRFGARGGARLMGGTKAWGTCGNATYLGGLLALVTPIAFAWHWWVVAGVLIAGLWTTQCKAAVAGLALASPVILLGAGVDMATVADVSDSLRGRLRCWGYAVGRFVQRPLTGWGQNSVRLPDAMVALNCGFFDTAESEVFQVLHDQGFLGMLALGWVWQTALSHAAFPASLVAYAVWLCLHSSHLSVSNLGWPLLALAVMR